MQSEAKRTRGWLWLWTNRFLVWNPTAAQRVAEEDAQLACFLSIMARARPLAPALDCFH